MEDLVSEYLLTDRETNSVDPLRKLVTHISDEMDNPLNPMGLSDLIELLEEPLTSIQERQRHRATALLAEVLAVKASAMVDQPPPLSGAFAKTSLTPHGAVMLMSEPTPSSLPVESSKISLNSSLSLDGMSLHILIVFFCRRLNDPPSTLPSVAALTVLLTFFRAYLEQRYLDALDIALTISRDISLPSQSQQIRQAILQLLSLVCGDDLFLETMQSESIVIVNGTVDNMEQERDPRCLLLVLRVLGRLTVAFNDVLREACPSDDDSSDYATLAEKVFDSVSCYFPISFTPPPDDPHGVTVESLTMALQVAMTNASAVAELAIGFFVDQLEGDSLSTRVAALQSMRAIVESHGVDIFQTNAVLTKFQETDHDDDGHGHPHPRAGQDTLRPMRRLVDLLIDIVLTEGASSIVDQAIPLFLQVVTAIRSLHKSSLIASQRDSLLQHIMQRILRELLPSSVSSPLLAVSMSSFASLRGKQSIRLMVCLSTLRDWTFNSQLVQNLFPTVLAHVQVASTRVHSYLQRFALASLRDELLLPERDARFRECEEIFQMCAVLVKIALPDDIDCSQLLTLRALSSEQLQALIDATLLCTAPKDRIALTGNNFDAIDDNQPMEGASKKAKTQKDRLVNIFDDEALTALCGVFTLSGQLLLRAQTANNWSVADSATSSSLEVAQRYVSSSLSVLQTGLDSLLFECSANSPIGISSDNMLSFIRQQLRSESGRLQSSVSSFFLKLSSEISSKPLFLESLFEQQVLPVLLSSCSVSPSVNVETSCEVIDDLIVAIIAKQSSGGASSDGLFSQLLTQLTNVMNSSDNAVLSRVQGVYKWIRFLERVCYGSGKPVIPSASNVALRMTFHRKACFLCNLNGYAALTPGEDISSLLETVLRWFVEHDTSQDCDKSVDNLLSMTIFYLYDCNALSVQDAKAIETFVRKVLWQILPEPNAASLSSKSLNILISLLEHVDRNSELITKCDDFQKCAFRLLQCFQCGEATKDIQLQLAKALAILVNKLSDNSLQIVLLEVYDKLLCIFQLSVVPLGGVPLLLQVFKALFLRPILHIVTPLPAWPMIDSSKMSSASTWQMLFLSIVLELLTPTSTSCHEPSQVTSECTHQLKDLLHEPIAFCEPLHRYSKGHYSLFWQQKLFTLLFPSLQQRAQTHQEDDGRYVSLIAAINVMRGVSESLLRSNFASCVDVVLIALSHLQHVDSSRSLSSVDVRTSACEDLEIQTIFGLQMLLAINPSPFADHLHIMIPRLAKTTVLGSSARLRIASLQCLQTIPLQFVYSKIHPHRGVVMRYLLSALDDRKRLVRQLAATVRNEWILLNTLTT